MNSIESFQGWYPYRLHWKNGRAQVQWFYAGDRKFHDPFFADTVNRCLSLEQNAERRLTSGEEYERIASATTAPSSVTFIYHISRCGSTMLAQMLAEEHSHVVLSEVPLLDEILRSDVLDNAAKRRYFIAAVH